MAKNKQTITYTRPYLYPLQLQAIFEPLDAFGNPARFSWIEASTKAGKTVGCIAWIYEQAYRFGGLNKNWWWVAPVFPQTEIAYRRLKAFLPSDLYDSNEGKLWVMLPNGGRIWFKSSDNPDSLFGEDVYGAVVDEASRTKQETFDALISVLTATKGQARLIGNVKGRKNWFFKGARRAELGWANNSYYKITAADAVAAGVLDATIIEGAKDALSERVFNELYNAEATDDGGNPFGLQYIQKIKVPIPNHQRVRCWGVDLAKGKNKGGDWTVATGLDDGGKVAEMHRWQGPWEDTINRLQNLIGTLTPALVDSTGVGDPIVERLQKFSANIEGYNFTAPSKQKLMEGLAVAVQKEETSVIEGVHEQEMESFEYEYTKTGVRYCLSPETKILKRNLNWVALDKIQVGDWLVGFDEFPIKGNKTRRWASSRVTYLKRIMQPSYRIKFDDGTEIISSEDHMWLVSVAGPFKWMATKDLRAPHPTSKSLRFSPHRVVRLLDVWERGRDYGAGYLAAAFGLLGRRDSLLRFLGQIRPKRLLDKFDLDKLGTLERKSFATVQEIEFIGQQPVIAMQTSTKTFVAEGLASHNCAPEGYHDDTVCSHALAIMAKKQGPDLSIWERLI